MAIDFGTQLYNPVYSQLARPVTFTPVASQPSASSYPARGIFGTEPLDVLAESNAIISDARTILDIIENEFPVLPAQGDIVDIPACITIPAAGTFEILDTDSNGFETTLTLRRLVVAKP